MLKFIEAVDKSKFCPSEYKGTELEVYFNDEYNPAVRKYMAKAIKSRDTEKLANYLRLHGWNNLRDITNFIAKVNALLRDEDEKKVGSVWLGSRKRK